MKVLHSHFLNSIHIRGFIFFLFHFLFNRTFHMQAIFLFWLFLSDFGNRIYFLILLLIRFSQHALKSMSPNFYYRTKVMLTDCPLLWRICCAVFIVLRPLRSQLLLVALTWSTILLLSWWLLSMWPLSKIIFGILICFNIILRINFVLWVFVSFGEKKLFIFH